MTDNMRQSVTASAAAHAERIRAGEQRAEAGKPVAGQSTAERIAARILPGYKADEELRERARLSELRARGVISADPEREDVDDEAEEYEEEADEEPEAETPKSTADLYAERERQRQQTERAATLAAHRSAGQVVPPPQGHRYAEQVAQQYRRTAGGPKPAA